MGMMMMEDDFEDLVDEGEVEEDICIEEDEDEELELAFVSNGGDSGEDDLFDAVVGKLEEILMDEGFNEQLASFMQSHCTVFDRAPEMKLEYTPSLSDIRNSSRSTWSALCARRFQTLTWNSSCQC